MLAMIRLLTLLECHRIQLNNKKVGYCDYNGYYQVNAFSSTDATISHRYRSFSDAFAPIRILILQTTACRLTDVTIVICCQIHECMHALSLRSILLTFPEHKYYTYAAIIFSCITSCLNVTINHFLGKDLTNRQQQYFDYEEFGAEFSDYLYQKITNSANEQQTYASF